MALECSYLVEQAAIAAMQTLIPTGRVVIWFADGSA